MYRTRAQLDDALARLKDVLPQMIAEHPDAAGFSAAFRKAAAAIEAQAGKHERYVSRSIDAMLASLVLLSSPAPSPTPMFRHLVN